MESIQGYKTYIVAAIAAGVWFASAFGMIDAETANQGYALLATVGGATLAAKINRLR